MNPRSCLRWQLTGRILKTVGLRWVPTGKLFNSCTSKVESEPTHGSNVDIHHIHACKQTLGLSAADQASVFMAMTFEHSSSSLGHQCLMMSDHNSSDLAPQRQMVSAENNTSGPVPQFKFKAGSKSCSLSKQDSYITTRVGITIPPSHSNAEDNRSIIISTHERRHISLINDRKPSIKHLHIFGCICYITRDGENLDKMKEKGDPCVMVGYSTQSKGYRVYNKRTHLIVESIHIKFDEIKEMMSDHNSSDLAPQRQEMSVENVSLGLVPQGQKASDYDNSDPVPPV
ncbi:retrovirus-related pol polyprotein from transposon TNT 1-94 [Tanacetum coccineum]